MPQPSALALNLTSGLADAISHWIAYKQRCGFEGLLSESMLVMPIAEYFIGHGLAVTAEQDLHRLVRKGKSGVINYDLVAENKGSSNVLGEAKILVEVKFITARGQNHARLHSDFVKLAVPEGPFTRFAVVARDLNVSFPSFLKETKTYSYGGGPQHHAIGNADVRTSIAGKLAAYGLEEVTCSVKPAAEHGNVVILAVDRMELPNER